ncbi:MAG: T9SS type A sorting domain-containing protein [Bacteroidales bacterium]|nr:T9SS type A sorting domain-containing protein [Bacteroidales bacterium]
MGTNDSTYASTSLLNGDTVICVLTSNAVCATGSPATSNSLLMIVNPSLPISVSISADPDTIICEGESVTFTATPINGGTAPTYQWKLNGFNVGTNSSTYTSTSLSNGDEVSCVITSNITDSSATSNILTMTVNPNLPVSVSISADPSTPICEGESVTFTATPTNGGISPTYAWYEGGVLSETTTINTFTTSTLTNGEGVYCILTSDLSCVVSSTATSNTINTTVNPNLPVSVSISANPGTTICEGESVTFTAIPTNGGTTPSYQWKLNGTDVGTNNTTYTNASLSDGDTVTCVLTSNATCATGSPATSNILTMTVNPNLPASVSISANPGTTICEGESVIFTATPINGGTAPTYQWQLNGLDVGSNIATYTNASLSDGDTVICVLTSNAVCVTDSLATSNILTMTVNPNLPVSVSISANPGTTICEGESVTFTAIPTNGGTAPTYQWQLNGLAVGSNNATYTNASLSDGDTVTCILTSNAVCATGSPATSNILTMTVNPNLPVSVSISANPGTTICDGESVIFTAIPTNGGTAPTYQWHLNGSAVGSNSSTYTNASLADGDIVTCVLTSSATCATGSPATSNILTMTVNPNLPASVSISANPGTTICEGESVTFTAIPTNGGTTPFYQWKLNGTDVGTNNTTYTNASLSDGDTITCVLTSNATCATGSPATSNILTMTVNPNLPVSVSISANPGTTICEGESVIFTATPINGGTAPTYQWKLNGSAVGSNSSTYTNASLADGDVVTCVLTSSATCATGSPATSNILTMTVNPNLPVSVSISANPGTTICEGESVTFTATPTNGGTAPTYQWQVNGSDVGTNSSTYTSTSLLNGDAVTCVLTSSATCAAESPATSNSLLMTVNPNLPVSVSISANTGTTVCEGESATFTAIPTNGGTTPSYQWKLNGFNVGTNSATYTNASLSNGDVVTCILTSNAVCATGNPATSNSLSMTVGSNLPVSVSISANTGTTVCEGESVTFTATPTNGGIAPSYQWKLNGSDVGTDSATYTNASLSNGDVVTCVLTSSLTCVISSTATSDPVTMSVIANVTPSISIVASETSICSGTLVTFVATPINGGTTPTYQWKLNGTNVGSNSATYTSTSLSDGDVVSCILTSSVTCVTSNAVASNSVTMSVIESHAVSLNVVASETTICSGTLVNFIATPTNGGANPVYQWTVNGNNVGTNSNEFSTDALLNGDVVACSVTSDLVCATNNPATESITMSVIESIKAGIEVIASPSTSVCEGTPISFNTNITNGGTNPTYQWLINNVDVGISTSTFTSSTLNNGDEVKCILTSNATCVVNSPVSSDIVSVSISPVTVGGSMSSVQTEICQGESTGMIMLSGNVGDVLTWQRRINGGAWINIPGSAGFESFSEIADLAVVGLAATWEYRAVVQSGECNVEYSTSTAINVLAIPTASFAYDVNGLTVSFTNTSLNATSYQWSFGDGTTSTEENPVHVYTDNRIYDVSLIAYNEMCQSEISILIDVESSIMEFEGSSISVYPNPSNGIVNIEILGNKKGNLYVEVYDVIGKLIKTEDLSEMKHGSVVSLDISNVEPGIYNIRFINEEKTFTYKVIIEK